MAPHLSSFLQCLFPQLDPRFVKYCEDKETQYSDSDGDSLSSDYDSSEGDEVDDDDELHVDEVQAAALQFLMQKRKFDSPVVSVVQSSTTTTTTTTTCAAKSQHGMRRGSNDGDVESNNTTATVVHVVQTKLPTQSFSFPQDSEEKASIKPKETLTQILESMGCSRQVRSYNSIDHYFLEPTQAQIAAYDSAIMGAVRREELDAIVEMHRQGRDLQCCNSFHESILHVVARRGSTGILRYLMGDGNCNLRVCCDSGRTPLHDACWTTKPNFDCIAIILRDSPDMLLIADKRNFTPLDYIPKDAWAAWNDFLQDNQELLRPKVLL